MTEILKMPYSYIFIMNDDETFSGEIAEFPGCFAQGETLAEAMENLTKAAETWIDAVKEQGLPVPEPMVTQDASGRVAFRLPKSLHKQASKLAALDGISLNQFLVDAVAEKVGAVNLYRYLSEHLSAQIVTNIPIVIFEPSIFAKRETTKTSFQPFNNLFIGKTADTKIEELINA